ncbi:MAG: ABC transporter permease [Nocardioidaceae bacterium]
MTVNLTVSAVADPATEIVVRGVSMRARLVATFVESKLLLVAGSIATLFVLLAVVGPYLAPYDPTESTGEVLVAPGGSHWFGTDAAGLDIFSRVIAGARVDITIALLATAVSVIVGSSIGLLSSFFGGRVGALVLRVSDVVQAFPLMVFAMIFVTMGGRNALNIVAVVAFLNVPIFIRLTRTQVVALKGRTFVEAARADGATEWSAAFRHVFPNSLTPVWAQLGITLGWSIIVTAGLSFIGAGIQPPTPEWGSMVAVGANGMVSGVWWPSVFPGLAMSLAVFGFAAVAEGVRRAMFDE